MIKVIVADDHDMVRQGIALILSDVEDISVIGEAKSGEDAVTLSRRQQPDVILMDVRMPGIGGLEATKKILAHRPDTGVIALSGYNDSSYPGMFMQAGAMGYITKGADYNDMIEAIRTVHEGKAYLSPEVADKVDAYSKNQHENPFDQLSDRELQIALMISECYSLDKIAEQLKLNPKTVNSYKYRVFDKLNVQSDVELTLLTQRHHMIDP